MTKQPFVLFRSFSSLIFIYAGIKHLTHAEGIFKRIATTTVYTYVHQEALFKGAILFSGAVMIAAGLAMLAGYQYRRAAGLLLAMLIPITLSIQLENLNDLGPFFKNVALTGSLLFIIQYGKHENKQNLSNYNTNAIGPGFSCPTGIPEGQPAVPAAPAGTYQPGHQNH